MRAESGPSVATACAFVCNAPYQEQMLAVGGHSGEIKLHSCAHGGEVEVAEAHLHGIVMMRAFDRPNGQVRAEN